MSKKKEQSKKKPAEPKAKEEEAPKDETLAQDEAAAAEAPVEEPKEEPAKPKAPKKAAKKEPAKEGKPKKRIRSSKEVMASIHEQALLLARKKIGNVSLLVAYCQEYDASLQHEERAKEEKDLLS